MPKLKTETIFLDYMERRDYKATFDVNVNSSGEFTTILKDEYVTMFQEAQIRLDLSPAKKLGFFLDKTYEGLVRKVENIFKEYFSRELESEKTIIRYIIQTSSTYCLTKANDIVPNGNWAMKIDGEYTWVEGTVTQNATSPRPYALTVQVRPVNRRTYRFKSGMTKVVDERIDISVYDEKSKEMPNLSWLSGLTSMKSPEGYGVMEIDYTEEIAGVFVDLIKGICRMNEMLKPFISPEGIKHLSENKIKLLG